VGGDAREQIVEEEEKAGQDAALRQQAWVVYCKPPFAGPETPWRGESKQMTLQFDMAHGASLLVCRS
jgi:hypothetical protein